MVSKKHIPPKDTSAYPMSLSDWASLKGHVLFHFKYIKYSGYLLKAFRDFEKKGWVLKYRSTDPYAGTAFRIKRSLRYPFKDLPKHLNIEAPLERYIINWRLEVGK